MIQIKNNFISKNRIIERKGYQEYKKHIKEVLQHKDGSALTVEVSRNNSKLVNALTKEPTSSNKLKL